MFKNSLHYSTNILNLYAHVCVSFHCDTELMNVHVILKIKICLQPFAVSRPISQAKLYRWNLNISKYLIKYLTKFHAGAKTENASTKS